MSEHYNYDSLANQRIKEQFVNREVVACISDMADHLFDWDGEKYASYDEFENFYVKCCPECGGTYGFTEDDRYDEDECEDKRVHICESCGHEFSEDEFEEMDTNPAEVYEWWIVTPWLGEKLKAEGEVVLDRWGGWIWGRQATGQAIMLDGVIDRICYNIGILEGQKYDWSEKV